MTHHRCARVFRHVTCCEIAALLLQWGQFNPCLLRCSYIKSVLCVFHSTSILRYSTQDIQVQRSMNIKCFSLDLKKNLFINCIFATPLKSLGLTWPLLKKSSGFCVKGSSSQWNFLNIAWLCFPLGSGVVIHILPNKVSMSNAYLSTSYVILMWRVTWVKCCPWSSSSSSYCSSMHQYIWFILIS